MSSIIAALVRLFSHARLAQSVERKALNLVVVGSSPTVGVLQRQQRSRFEITLIVKLRPRIAQADTHVFGRKLNLCPHM